jgi:hypothetical protein
MIRTRHWSITLVLAFGIVASVASVQAQDAKALLTQMKGTLEPAKSSARTVKLTVTGDGSTSAVVLGQARGTMGGGNQVLTVVLAPADVRGTAYLVQEQPASANDRLWVYLPAIGRVREVVSPEAFSAFLNSDYTYSDLGFISLRSKYGPVKQDTVNGVKANVIEEVPPQNWYYARIVSTVASDSSLPLDRKFYDPANQLWKDENFEKVAVIDGVPTVMTTTMNDVQAKSSSTLDVQDVKYNVDIPADLLTPAGLVKAASSPIWSSLKGAPAK